MMGDLSICIPNYNMAPWLAEAIRSALMQPASEIIVVDNASTDESRGVMGQFSDDRLALHAPTEHVTMFENINRAVSLATAEWCVVLCADDELLASFHRQLIRGWEACPDAAVVSQSAIDPDIPRIIGDTTPSLYETGAELLRSPMLPLSAAAFRREAFEAVGGFDEAAGWPGDWDFWLRVVMGSGPLYATGGPGALYHRSRGAWATVENSREEIEIFERWVDYRRAEWPPDVIAEMESSLAERYERVGRVLLARDDREGLGLLRVAAAAGRGSASRRLRLEEHRLLARGYRSFHKRARGVIRGLESRFPS